MRSLFSYWMLQDDASLVQRQLALALAQQETAQAQQKTAQAQVGMAVNNLGRANAKLEDAERVGDTKKVKEAKEEVKEAEQKVKEAKEEVKEAEQKVEKAEQKVEKAKEEVEKAKAESESKAGDFKAVLRLLSFGVCSAPGGTAGSATTKGLWVGGRGRADSNMLVPVPCLFEGLVSETALPKVGVWSWRRAAKHHRCEVGLLWQRRPCQGLASAFPGPL